MDLWEPPVDAYEPMQSPQRRDVPVSAPAPKPTAAPAASKPAAAPKAVPATPATAAKRVLRPLKVWTEAVDRVRATSPMAASFLVSAKAYTAEDGRVIIKLESDFIRTMVSREGAPEALRAALSVCLGRKLEVSDILYEVDETKPAEESLLDLVIEAAEE